MTDDRAKSLIIAYKCSSYKRTCFDQNIYVGPSPSSQLKIQVPSTSFKFRIQVEDLHRNCEQTVKELQILQSNSPRTTHAKETQTEIESAEMRRN